MWPLLTGLLLCGCSGPGSAGTLPNPVDPTAAPRYAELIYWAAHPALRDLSDSLPAPYRPHATDTTVDVFFIHPTSYRDNKTVDPARLDDPAERALWNAAIMDPGVNRRTDEGSMLYQASAFNHYRVFAPRYRQAHIRAFYLPDSLSKPFFDTAYADVRHAFEYYLQHENRGRPFIIASHSQGTLHAGRLIRELIEGRRLQEQLVAAYLIGLPVPANFFSAMPACTDPASTGCFVSWRTFHKGHVPENVKKERFQAVVINPLNWSPDSTWVPRQYHKGAVLYKFNRPKPANVGAAVHGNILWSSKPRFFGNFLFTRKNYH
ncbi:MAG TPA: DUF3089 domain-containing protein, partial [Phnomibacter sp.]|nr:DUF3089 domain-containing protein [Phnomibacter sp.]